jgi:drug/metabolite transporter (DMT)-like permease
LGGLQVISWALVFSAPVLIVPAVLFAPSSINLPLESWLGFLYITVISQFLGFFFWYHGLALGGIAKVSQIQLVQPFLTIMASALLLGERADILTWLVAAVVLVVVAIGKNSRVVNVNSNPTVADACKSGARPSP